MSKFGWTSAALAGLFVFCGTARAQAPLAGVYLSVDVGGSVLSGRYSESWNGDRLQSGNAVSAFSWDKSRAEAGEQWTISCPAIIAPPLLLQDTVDKWGKGKRVYTVTLTGGGVTLDGTGPWGGGAASYSGTIASYIATATVNYYNGNVVSTSQSIIITGSIEGFAQSCLQMTLEKVVEYVNTSNGAELWKHYPGFKDLTCGDDAPSGAWGEMFGVSVVISGCTTPVETRTWGSVKSLYRQ